MVDVRNRRGQSRQDYETPPDFIAAVEKRFGKIDFDLAATPQNTKGIGYFSPETDSLSQDWNKVNGVLWLNPPFGNIKPWAKKCSEWRGNGLLLFHIPASIGSKWFAEYIYPFASIIALRGRITYVGMTHAFDRDMLLCVYGPVQGPHFEVWNWHAA